LFGGDDDETKKKKKEEAEKQKWGDTDSGCKLRIKHYDKSN